MSEPRCGTCKWAKPSDLIGWKLCTFPLPEKPKLPYWALHNDAWKYETVDVEETDTDCPTYEAMP
jgi:hypothetical protein